MQFQFLLDDPWCFRDFWPGTYSAFNGHKLIGVGGVTMIACVPAAWALFTTKITPACFMPIHKMAVWVLTCYEQVGYPLFAQLDGNYPEAMRWAKILGLETRRTDVLPDGRRMMRVPRSVG